MDEDANAKQRLKANAPGCSPDPSGADGRFARRATNRLAVIDAYLDLVHGGNPFPSVDEISERSGVSHRSVFRYFTDRDAMARASIERQHERLQVLMDREIDLCLPFDMRTEQIIEKRLDFYRAAWPTARLCRVLALTQPILLEELTSNRSKARAEVKRTFRTELAGLQATDARDALALLDVALSLESIDLLVRDQGFSRPRSARALHRAVASILGVTPGR